jgi:hypothetical protein
MTLLEELQSVGKRFVSMGSPTRCEALCDSQRDQGHAREGLSSGGRRDSTGRPTRLTIKNGITKAIDDRLIAPEPLAPPATRSYVYCRKRLGGLLRYYHRAA